MRTNSRLHSTRHFPLFFAGIVSLWLCNGARPILAQDESWLPNNYVIDPTNWFEADNWQPLLSFAPSVPMATQSASVNTTTQQFTGASAPATIGPNATGAQAAVANELLIGGMLTLNGVRVGGAGGVGGVVISPAGPGAIGEVIINGPNASLTLGQNKPPVSLDVIQGSLVVQNGGTLTTFGSGVGRIAGATAPPGATAAGLVTVSGSGSSWIENGALVIGSQSSGSAVIADGASFQGAQSVTVGTLGQLNIGTGGLGGTFNAPGITNNGVINFNFTDSTTLSAQVSGSGQIAKLGSGTLILTGNNTYSGGTTISAGTLQLGNGGTTGSVTGNVIDDGILAFDRSDSVTFGGVISGTGSVVKLGTGTLTLTGTNTYTGATTVNAGSLIVDGSIASAGTTTVNAGSLIVDGSIASAQTLVNAGGLLGGHGSLGGSLVNSGIVSPGDSPGTLTVNSNYIQNAGGTLRIQIAGLAASQHDLLAVNGHASLAGTLQLIGLGGFTLHVGDQVTFLTANGGVSGSFGTVQNQLTTGTLVNVQVVDLPNSVVLEGTQGSFVQFACNPNSVAAAQALNSAVGNPRASTLIAFLDDQPLNNLCGDFTLIAPEALASIFNAGVSLANVQTANLIRRLEDIRAGSTGFNSSGFTLNGSPPNFSGGFAGVSGPEGKSGPSVMTPTPENRWGVWVTGIGEFTNVDSTNDAAGYDIRSGGVTLGVDYRFTSCFAIGLTAGYANINADLPDGGNLDVNAGQLGFYATAFGSGFYADAAVTGGPSGYDSRRTALLGSASGNTDGGNFNVLIAAGYDWQKGGLSIGPTANFQYSYVGFSSFTESGSIAPLKFPSQNAESERTAFGMKASYDWKVGHVIIRPELSLAWQHEFGDQSYSIVSSFANGAGNSFTVNSPQVGRDSLLIGAGAAVLLSDRVSLYAYYDGEQLRTNYHSNSVSAGVRMTF